MHLTPNYSQNVQAVRRSPEGNKLSTLLRHVLLVLHGEPVRSIATWTKMFERTGGSLTAVARLVERPSAATGIRIPARAATFGSA